MDSLLIADFVLTKRDRLLEAFQRVVNVGLGRMLQKKKIVFFGHNLQVGVLSYQGTF